MPIILTRDDPRYASLQKGHNARFPETEIDAAKRIFLCETSADATNALQQIVSAGLRPTIRSGGHCYEDFVANNPGGAILDLSLLSGVNNGRSAHPIGLIREYSSGTDTSSCTNAMVSLFPEGPAARLRRVATSAVEDMVSYRGSTVSPPTG
jgi:hypothetical protein